MNERNIFELVDRIKSDDPEEIIKEVLEYVWQDEELVQMVVFDYAENLAQQVIDIKNILNGYHTFKNPSPSSEPEPPKNPFKDIGKK